MTTTAIVVNFNAGGLLVDCVRSLFAGNEVAGVRVVDNASTDGSATALAVAFADHAALDLQSMDRNLGFAAAVNAAAAGVSTDKVLVINPDCRLDPGALATLESALDADPGAALAAPAVRDGRGRPEPASFRRFPDACRALMQFSGLARLSRGRGTLGGVTIDPADWPVDIAAAEAVSGACMLIRTADFRALGGFDEAYGLHCEDLDFMFRLHQAGRRRLFVPGAGAEHVQGVSSASRPLWVHRQKHKGMRRFFDLHQAKDVAWPMRCLVRTGIWAHWAVTWPLVWLRR